MPSQRTIFANQLSELHILHRYYLSNGSYRTYEPYCSVVFQIHVMIKSNSNIVIVCKYDKVHQFLVNFEVHYCVSSWLCNNHIALYIVCVDSMLHMQLIPPATQTLRFIPDSPYIIPCCISVGHLHGELSTKVSQTKSYSHGTYVTIQR